MIYAGAFYLQPDHFYIRVSVSGTRNDPTTYNPRIGQRNTYIKTYIPCGLANDNKPPASIVYTICFHLSIHFAKSIPFRSRIWMGCTFLLLFATLEDLRCQKPNHSGLSESVMRILRMRFTSGEAGVNRIPFFIRRIAFFAFSAITETSF